VTVRLHTALDADREGVTRMFDKSVADIRRILSGR
jgi:hypothetical protein